MINSTNDPRAISQLVLIFLESLSQPALSPETLKKFLLTYTKSEPQGLETYFESLPRKDFYLLYFISKLLGTVLNMENKDLKASQKISSMIEPFAFRFAIALTLNKEKFAYLFKNENLTLKSGLTEDHTWTLAIFIMNFAEYSLNNNLIEEFNGNSLKKKRDRDRDIDISETTSIILPGNRINGDSVARKMNGTGGSSAMKSSFGYEKIKNENDREKQEEEKKEQMNKSIKRNVSEEEKE